MRKSSMPRRKGKMIHLNVDEGDIKKLDCSIHDEFVRKGVDQFDMDKLVGLIKQLLSNKEGLYYFHQPEDNQYDVILKKNGKLKELMIQFLGIK